MKRIDITGQRFGRLVAIAFDEAQQKKDRHTKWQVRCDCGAEFSAHFDALRAGATKSCGCFKKEVTAVRSLTHGHSVNRKPSVELKAYAHAKARCYNPKDEKFPNYGARGITMCDEWREDAAKFIAYMGPKPPGMTLERLRVNEGYKPGNCVWASPHAQARNRTDNVFVEYAGERMILKDCATRVGVNYKSLHYHVRTRGVPLGEALDRAALV